jgi:hypothetical protein
VLVELAVDSAKHFTDRKSNVAVAKLVSTLVEKGYVTFGPVLVNALLTEGKATARSASSKGLGSQRVMLAWASSFLAYSCKSGNSDASLFSKAVRTFAYKFSSNSMRTPSDRRNYATNNFDLGHSLLFALRCCNVCHAISRINSPRAQDTCSSGALRRFGPFDKDQVVSPHHFHL